MTRAELLAELFNAAPRSVAVGGTSGKSTVTGMIGWILTDAGLDPTIMNGGVMKNFVSDGTPFASARVGHGGVFVSEVDESDGSIALFRPEVAVLNNISLDHKSLDELRQLFGDFARTAKRAVWNADDIESVALLAPMGLGDAISFGFTDRADVRAVDVVEMPLASRFTLKANGQSWPVTLQVPGRHNISNALAAIAAALALDVPLAQAVQACLDSEEARQQVRASDERARQMGVQGVPFFIFNNQVGLSGAHEPETLLQAMAQSLEPQAGAEQA